MTALLSVVVIGRNEGLRLERCLRSIRMMEDPGGEVELIYVDSASTDSSVEIAERFGATVVSVKPQRPTAALGRNAGWRLTTAPVVLFLDGDTILHPRFVIDSLPNFDNPAIAVVWGHRREIRPEQSWLNRTLDLDWIYKPGLTEFCGGDALVRRSALVQVNGYDEGLIAGEEPEMCRRLRGIGYEILHVDLPMTGHDLAMKRFGQYWKRATRAGYAFAEVSSRFRETGLPFWEEDVERNRLGACLILTASTLSILAALTFFSFLPLVIFLAFYSLISLRTAYKSRWKSNNLLTLLAYGLHSHVQQIPIYFGQLQFRRDVKRGHLRDLIEYKGVAE